MVLVEDVLSDGYQSYVLCLTVFLIPIAHFFCKVSEDPKEEGKAAFVNFKRVVWHESFNLIIQSIVGHSKHGCWLKCGDDVERWLFPTILILSADYEEQYVPHISYECCSNRAGLIIRCMMSLIRGTKSKWPCPICLVKSDELVDITRTWPLRSADQNQNLVQRARNLQRATDREKLLSEFGIRDVDVSHIQLCVHAN
jgi:hypothetical protein